MNGHKKTYLDTLIVKVKPLIIEGLRTHIERKG